MGGGAGGLPANTLLAPQLHTARMAGVRMTQPATSGTAMRLPRFAQKPRAPSLWNNMRPKNPAMKKNSDMRKMCDTKAASARNGLGELSFIAQNPGGRPGMKDIAAWNATPNNRAKPRTASRACSRDSGAFIFVLLGRLWP